MSTSLADQQPNDASCPLEEEQETPPPNLDPRTPDGEGEATPPAPLRVEDTAPVERQAPEAPPAPAPDALPDAQPDAPPPPAPDAPPSSNAPHAPGTLISDQGEVYTPPPRAEIIVFVREKHSRKKAGETAAKPGKGSWVWGTKLKFFEAWKDEWVKASEARKTGEFYTKLARLYTAKYGFDLGDHEDFAVESWILLIGSPTRGGGVASNYWKTCRDRLGQWYRHQYTNLLKEDKTAFGELFSQLNGARKPPRKQAIQHYYSLRWYDQRIKPCVEAQLVLLRTCAKFTGEEVHPINVQNEVTHECWEEESEEFKAEMVRQRDREHEITMKAWRESAADSPSRTPEEYHA
ncbi:hypothetical protein B0H12DRAFT_1071523 [Mycena haematopus]|nr:hypothetical protein B0H12DRAFT_1071523 [Mycena haematopus]